MASITPAQIRGACGMLAWSLLDLAKAAHLSVSVVLSASGRDPRRVSPEAMTMMRAALEARGMEFASDEDGAGVRLRSRAHSVFPFHRLT